jgi:hypothetical protein
LKSFRRFDAASCCSSWPVALRIPISYSYTVASRPSAAGISAPRFLLYKTVNSRTRWLVNSPGLPGFLRARGLRLFVDRKSRCIIQLPSTLFFCYCAANAFRIRTRTSSFELEAQHFFQQLWLFFGNNVSGGTPEKRKSKDKGSRAV